MSNIGRLGRRCFRRDQAIRRDRTTPSGIIFPTVAAVCVRRVHSVLPPARGIYMTVGPFSVCVQEATGYHPVESLVEIVWTVDLPGQSI